MNRENVLQWRLFSEQIQQATRNASNNSNDDGQVCQSLNKKHSGIATSQKFGLPFLGDGNAVLANDTHPLGLQKFKDRHKIIGSIFAQNFKRYSIAIFETFKGIVVNAIARIRLAINKFFNTHKS